MPHGRVLVVRERGWTGHAYWYSDTMGAETDETLPHGRQFYDDETVFSTYMRHRDWSANPNTLMEEPAVLEALGDIREARVLDLGCGSAETGLILLRSGCQSYHGVDSSTRMVERARATLGGTSGTVTLCPIEHFKATPNSFDLVLSRLALHHVEHIDSVLESSHQWLADVGRLVFTVPHPVITSHDAREATIVQRTHWVVDNYFEAGARPQQWMGGKVIWFHRTIEEYVRALQVAGFRLSHLGECTPRPEYFPNDQTEYRRRRRIPLFLLLAGTKA